MMPASEAIWAFVAAHGSTIILCVVLMWLVFNWRESVGTARMYKMMLDMSGRWESTSDKHYERQHELIKDLFETTDKLRLEACKAHEDLMKSRSENDDLLKELHHLRKALWIEKNGPLGDDDVFF